MTVFVSDGLPNGLSCTAGKPVPHCRRALFMPRKSLFRSAEKPLSLRHFYRYRCRNSISHKQSEYYAQRLKTRVFASETLSVNSIGTLAEFSTYALHKYTVPDEYSCITRLTLYLLIVIPMEYESYVVSLHKISCTREIKSKLSFLSFALSLHKISCTREIKSKLSFLSFALSLHKTSRTRQYNARYYRTRLAASQNNRAWRIMIIRK